MLCFYEAHICLERREDGVLIQVWSFLSFLKPCRVSVKEEMEHLVLTLGIIISSKGTGAGTRLVNNYSCQLTYCLTLYLCVKHYRLNFY